MIKSEDRRPQTGRVGKFRLAHAEPCFWQTGLLLVGLFAGIAGAAGLGIETASQTPLLRDGFILRDVDGTLTGCDGNDVRSFKLSEDVNDSISVVRAGTRLELLPSSALEQMVADAKMRSIVTYRLRNGRVTKYKGRNFIFPNSFLPLIEPKKPQAEESPEPGQDQKSPGDAGSERESGREMALDEPNDVLAMPPEIAEKLRARRQEKAPRAQRVADSNTVGIDQLQQAIEDANLPRAVPYTSNADSILAERTAFLVRQPQGRLLFSLDALGRNIQKGSLRLLPCEALELAEQEQSAEPERVRFKIAGIVTQYKGNSYLLLHRATRAYSHGNFGR
ncbi:MAG: hypothetical protein JSW66_18080 [Phycisphaerales bacterium]|nr:MAG: hypothetical protein JSW66_18080 [Phycisphaerales bacterium]